MPRPLIWTPKPSTTGCRSCGAWRSSPRLGESRSTIAAPAAGRGAAGLTMGVLVLDHVVKRFGEFTAVNDLSFDVPEGAIFGFLGGNGAGKTTSLRMVLDILRPTSGRIEVLGHETLARDTIRLRARQIEDGRHHGGGRHQL